MSKIAKITPFLLVKALHNSSRLTSSSGRRCVDPPTADSGGLDESVFAILYPCCIEAVVAFDPERLGPSGFKLCPHHRHQHRLAMEITAYLWRCFEPIPVKELRNPRQNLFDDEKRRDVERMFTTRAVSLDVAFQNMPQTARCAAAAHPDENLGNVGGFDLVHHEETHGQLEIRLAAVGKIISAVFFIDPSLGIKRQVGRHPALFEQAIPIGL